MAASLSNNMVRFEEIISETYPVAMIRKEPGEISQLNNLEFQESYDDLDYLVFATLLLPSGNQVCLVRHLHSPEPGIEICVRYKQSNIPIISIILRETLSEINLIPNDLTWIHPEYEQLLYELIKEQQSYELKIYNQSKDLRYTDFSYKALKRIILRQYDLRQTIFRKAELGMADLQASNLREANFQEADLREVNFQGANLQEANLQKADLRRANLQGVDLQGANLQEANLQKADLRRANLKGAKFQRADFQRANLKGADLTDTKLNGASFKDADVEDATLKDIQWDTSTMWFHVIGLHKAIGIPDSLRQQPNFKYYITLSQGIEELKDSKLDKFRTKYRQVLVEIKDQEIAASLWNKIAWLSSLHENHDEETYKAAVKAVELQGDKGNYHDTLGIVLALRQDFDSAINEFHKALESEDVQRWSSDFKNRRKNWIKALETGKMPFTTEEMKTLRDFEY